MTVAPVIMAESVHPNAASPWRVRRVSIAVRSSVTWSARITLASGVSVESEKTRLKRAVTARA